MNHILLPGTMQAGDEGLATRYGVHAMELLINRIMRLGGSKQNLRAKYSEGQKCCTLRPCDRHCGHELRIHSGIPEARAHSARSLQLGGTSAVTVWFEPVTGKVRIRRIPRPKGREIVSHELACEAPIFRAAPRVSEHNVTLFYSL